MNHEPGGFVDDQKMFVFEYGINGNCGVSLRVTGWGITRFHFNDAAHCQRVPRPAADAPVDTYTSFGYPRLDLDARRVGNKRSQPLIYSQTCGSFIGDESKRHAFALYRTSTFRAGNSPNGAANVA